MAESDVDVIATGWGWKQGSFVKNWKRRFFVLREILASELTNVDEITTHFLLYFKSEAHAASGDDPTGAVPISKGKTTITGLLKSKRTGSGEERWIKLEPAKTTSGFTSIFVPKIKSFYMIPDDGSFDDWVHSLTYLIPSKQKSEDAIAADKRRQSLGKHPSRIVPSIVDRNSLGDDDILPMHDYCIVDSVVPAATSPVVEDALEIEAKTFDRIGVSKAFVNSELQQLQQLDPKGKMSLADYLANKKKVPKYAKARQPIYTHHADEVGTANMFISHPFNMRATQFLQTVVSSMTEDDFAWIGLYMVSQYDTPLQPESISFRLYESLIQQTGYVVAILTPWKKPTALTRTWCLFEMAAALRHQVRLDVVVPKGEENELRLAIFENYADVMEQLTAVDFLASTSTDTVAYREMLSVVNEYRGGVKDINTRIRHYLRQWVLELIQQFAEQGGDGIVFAKFCIKIGAGMQDNGEYEKALDHYFKALPIFEKLRGKDHIETSSAYNSVGMVFDHIGDSEKALEYLFKALAGREVQSGTNNPLTAETYTNIGFVYESMGDYQNTPNYGFKALAVNENLMDSDSPDLAASYSNVASVYQSMGDFEQSLKYFL